MLLAASEVLSICEPCAIRLRVFIVDAPEASLRSVFTIEPRSDSSEPESDRDWTKREVLEGEIEALRRHAPYDPAIEEMERALEELVANGKADLPFGPEDETLEEHETRLLLAYAYSEMGLKSDAFFEVRNALLGLSGADDLGLALRIVGGVLREGGLERLRDLLFAN